jgi:hypothetical protein
MLAAGDVVVAHVGRLLHIGAGGRVARIEYACRGAANFSVSAYRAEGLAAEGDILARGGIDREFRDPGFNGLRLLL